MAKIRRWSTTIAALDRDPAIDRLVEPGGLVRLSWRAERTDGTSETVDSYLRPQDQSAQALAAAITVSDPWTAVQMAVTGKGI